MNDRKLLELSMLMILDYAQEHEPELYAAWASADVQALPHVISDLLTRLGTKERVNDPSKYHRTLFD